MKDTKLSNEQVENIVRVIIDGKTYLAKQDDGSYTGEICADYQDKLDTDSIKKIAQSDSPMETFIECFDTIDVEDAERDQVLKEISDIGTRITTGYLEPARISLQTGYGKMSILISPTTISLSKTSL